MQYGIIPLVSKKPLQFRLDNLTIGDYTDLSQGKYLSTNLVKNFNFIPIITFDGFIFREASMVEKPVIALDFYYPFLEGGIKQLSDFIDGVVMTSASLSPNIYKDNHYLLVYKQNENSTIYNVNVLSGTYNLFSAHISSETNYYQCSSSFSILNSFQTVLTSAMFNMLFQKNKYNFTPTYDDYMTIKLSNADFQRETANSDIEVQEDVVSKILKYKTTILTYQINYLNQFLDETQRMRFYRILQKTLVDSFSIQVANNVDVYPINDKPLYLRNMGMPYSVNVSGTVLLLDDEEKLFLEEVFGLYEDIEQLEMLGRTAKTNTTQQNETLMSIKKHNFVLKVPYIDKSNETEEVVREKRRYVTYYIQPQNIAVVRAGDYGNKYKLNISGMVSSIKKG